MTMKMIIKDSCSKTPVVENFSGSIFLFLPSSSSVFGETALLCDGQFAPDVNKANIIDTNFDYYPNHLHIFSK